MDEPIEPRSRSTTCTRGLCETEYVLLLLLFIATGTLSQQTPSCFSMCTAATRPQLDRLRNLVRDCLAKHLYNGAAFFADKLVTFSQHTPADVWLLSQAFYMNKQYHRCLVLLKQSQLIDEDVRCRYLAARCLSACGEWEECIAVLEDKGPMPSNAEAMTIPSTAEPVGQEISDTAACHLLRGRAYQALENTAAAVQCFKEALHSDPYCYEAFQALVDYHYLTNDEELALIQNLQVRPEDRWLLTLYCSRAKKYNQVHSMEAQLQQLEGSSADTVTELPRTARAMPFSFPTPPPANATVTTPGVRTRARARHEQETLSPSSSSMETGMEEGTPMLSVSLPPNHQHTMSLHGNTDVLACKADWYYQQGLYQDAYAITSAIVQQDPYHLEHLPLHMAAAVELGRKDDLFLLAHKLVNEHPDRAVSWFAVACYYMSTQQYDNACRYFGKATNMDRMFAAAWIGFGHAFAAQDESDKAMAAYRSAARSFPGLQMPLVGMGMEFMRMNNVQLAEQMLCQARAICSTDPLTIHELGVLAFKQSRFEEATVLFEQALGQVPTQGRQMQVWEATLNNLGHACRRLGSYSDALRWYNDALSLCPWQAGTHAAIGLTKHLQGNTYEAIQHYHKALGLRPDDTVTVDLLTIAMEGLDMLEADLDLPEPSYSP